MKLLCLSLVVMGALAVSKKAEEAVGAVTHKVHGNVALLDGNGNTVKASCGEPDRRGKLTHGRTEWVNGVKTCVDWVPETTGTPMNRECGTYEMKCCDADQVLMKDQMNYDGSIICKYEVPMCMKHSTKQPGYVTFEPTRCNLGDGTVHTCGGDFICCDEGTSDIHYDGYNYKCRWVERAEQETPAPVPVVEDKHVEGCNPNFKDIDGDGCDAYVDPYSQTCDEEYFDEYANNGVTAAVCPQCGCTDSSLFFATSKGESVPTMVVYGFAAVGVIAALAGVKKCLTKNLNYETISDSTEV